MNAIDYALDRQPSAAPEAPAGEDLAALRPLPRISIHAFCASDETQSAMEACGRDRRMTKVNLKITRGGVAAAASMFANLSTPNLIILETSTEPHSLLQELAPLAAVCDPSTKVVIIGRHNDIALYRELMRNGISEYLVTPVGMVEIMAAIAGIFVDPDAEPLGRTIAFIGAKGGVGSSTIAHNCAFDISHLFSSEVVIADLDLPYGTANINFDQDPPQGMSEAVFSPERLDEVFLDRLLTKCSEHLSLLAAPSMLDRAFDYPADAFSPLMDVLQRSAPVSVLDVPHAWNDWTRQVLANADDLVITAAPDLANLRNAKNMVDTLRKLRPNDKPPHFILNQVGMPKRPEVAPADFAESLELEPAAIIPFDAALFGQAANSGRMIAETDRKSPAAETFAQLAHLLTGRVTAKKARKAGLSGVLDALRRR
ncbi:CtpF protein [Rhizobium rhizosphaerae]|uniref:CtpF protein n=1 Tax=Xaviernesmea rhizosphaerae TaxID=1672749 RepID=A0A1Q9AQ48_9HYPH|nr:CpaE family protein [Xaviernesmea rhizosphaerae]OLP57538.1 CtpF protein [Xaviernesmea rhizosphaerae]OQP83829.1 CtpF protein [Xaviernesmea rhizosphaerae]